MNNLASSLVTGVLSIKPLAKFAKSKARTMMIDRAETLGVHWRDEVQALRSRDNKATASQNTPAIHPDWEKALAQVSNPKTDYPNYYTNLKIHAYEEGNLGWLPAMEANVAAQTVHARIWPAGDARAGLPGDTSLRNSYHQALTELLPAAPTNIIDLGCSAGRSSFTLQETFPQAQITGVDLSPYFLAIAQYQATQQQSASVKPKPAEPEAIRWIHAAAEETGLPAQSADLVSACLVFHELPEKAAEDIIQEAYRLVRPGGHFAIMDMDPECETFKVMPPYVLTLLKSTEPFLDQYLNLNLPGRLVANGFSEPRVVKNSPRHRTIVSQKTS